MKNILSIISSVAILVLTILPASAQLLNNGNFNTGDTTGWWTYVPDAVNSSLTVANNAGLTFDGSSYLYIMARNPSSDPILGQDPAVAAGSQYQVSLNYRGNNWGGAGVSIQYKDSSWNYVNYEWSTLYTGDGSDTGWQSFTSPIWTAPANTAYVEVRLDGYGWSDTYIDNVTLTVIPEPSSAVLLGLGAVAFLINRRRA